MRPKFIFILLPLFLLLEACSTNRYSINSYKQVSKEISKTYNLSRADLVLSYDLARLDGSSCIFSKDFGLFANEQIYAKEYLQKFKSRYKSPKYLSLEARNKVKKICNLLIRLQGKHKVLSTTYYNKVKKLANSDLNKLDSRKELIKLDVMTQHLPLMLPSYNPCFSSAYGNRKHPITKKYKMHCGIDLVAKQKSPIYASAYGKVSFVGMKNNGYGVVVEIDHGPLFKTKYAHLKQAFVKRGQKVIRGQAIGLQGCSGNATGDHLHFEIYIAGKHVNPYDFIGYNYKCF